MVKIRYAGVLHEPQSRFAGRTNNEIACTIISEALNATSLKFNNNIKFNRFDAVGNVYQVTLKCISSRGKGAKVSIGGRHLIACCWHVWGTFMDELFRLNPDIIITSGGRRITSMNNDQWVNDPNNRCDCGCDGDAHIAWIREQNAASQAIQDAEEEIDTLIAATAHAEINADRMTAAADEAIAHAEAERSARHEAHWNPQHNCDDSCRHSRSNNNGTPCTRDCVGSGNPGWEPQQTTPRECRTCRYSSSNTSNGASQCPPGSCLSREGLQSWAPIVHQCDASCRHNSENNKGVCCQLDCDRNFSHWEPFQDEPNTSCANCQHTPSRTGFDRCPFDDPLSQCLSGGQHRKFERHPARSCDDCEHNYDENGSRHMCHPIVGLCRHYDKWKPYRPFTVVGAPTSRYDTQMVERVEQMEQLIGRPMLTMEE